MRVADLQAPARAAARPRTTMHPSACRRPSTARKRLRFPPHPPLHSGAQVHVPCVRDSDSNNMPPVCTWARRVYVPRVQDSDSNMHFLHLDRAAALRAVPPFGIREPPPEYEGGAPREDVLEAEAPLELVRCGRRRVAAGRAVRDCLARGCLARGSAWLVAQLG